MKKKHLQPLAPAALYARVSSDRRDVDLSVSAQLRALKDYAKSNGYSVAREYVDEAESGRVADRPQFREMIEEGSKPKAPFDVILVWKFSRFTRKREHAVAFKSMLRRKGIRVVSITEQAEDNATGRLLEAIIESVDEFYSENLAQDVVRGMREAASRGFFLASNAPFGYKRVKVVPLYQRLPRLVTPRSFSSLHISLRPLPLSDFSNISLTTGAVAGSTSRVGRSFKGRVDLRSLLLRNPSDKWYLTFDGNAPDQPLELHPQSGSIEATDFLPSEDYFLGDEETGMRPRLIEKWLPINQISTETIRERAGAVPNPAPHQLHVWWARRPLAPSRASTLLSLIPQSADDEDTRHSVLNMLGTSPDIHRIALHLAAAKERGERDKDGYGDHRRAFTHNPTTEQLDWLKANLPNANPTVLDVTAGGGSIPFEAGRLGFRTIANELNPVACLILRATCEWPQRYGYPLLDAYRQCAEAFQSRVSELLADVYPAEYAHDCTSGNCPHPQRYRCSEDCGDPDHCNHQKLGSKNHEAVRAQRYVWARTARCPGCNVEIPLSPNWRLDNSGTGMRVEPDGSRIELRIVHDRQACSDCKSSAKSCHLATLYPNRSASDGTVTGAIATCPACGSTTPKGYLAQEAQAGRMGHRLYCVIHRDSWRDLTKAGKPKKRETTCRVFAEPEERHFAGDAHVASEVARLAPQWDADDALPTEEMPDANKARTSKYGTDQWIKLFNPRQQLAHGYCVQAFRECVDADAEAERLDDCRNAAWGYVAAALDKMINRNCILARWEPRTSTVVGTFDSHDFGMKWSYCEMIVGGPHGYGLSWAIDDLTQCLSQLLAMTGHVENAGNNGQLIPQTTSEFRGSVAPPTEVIRGDARDLPLDDASVDCVVFDPPYEENVCYAELSDFFYVWLKRTAGYVFPEDFTDYLTEKDQEAIASPARFKSQAAKGKSAKNLALADYQEKMAEIFTECRRVIKDDGIMTVMFNHKSTAAWDALTVALIKAEFAITRTWPVKTEAEYSIHIKDKAAARTTILLVCRPREENPFPKPWHEVEQLITQAVQEDIQDNLGQADLRPIDLYLSAFGPALRVISEHWGTERESNNPDRQEAPFLVTPADALQVARREVSRHRAQEISREWANNPMDAATKFYVLAKDATENDTLLFDEANLLARAIGVRLEKNDSDMKPVVGFKADKVSLLSARDRLAARNIGEDINPGSTLDTVHMAIALTPTGATRWGCPAMAHPAPPRPAGGPIPRYPGGPHPHHQAGPRRLPSATEPLAVAVRRGSAATGSSSTGSAVK